MSLKLFDRRKLMFSLLPFLYILPLFTVAFGINTLLVVNNCLKLHFVALKNNNDINSLRIFKIQCI